jgi:hypothetical protein
VLKYHKLSKENAALQATIIEKDKKATSLQNQQWQYMQEVRQLAAEVVHSKRQCQLREELCKFFATFTINLVLMCC